jgi:hypothetical protein
MMRRLAVRTFGQGKRDIENFCTLNGVISARQRTLQGSDFMTNFATQTGHFVAVAQNLGIA